MSVLLCKDDIPGSSQAGRNPAELKTEELRYWLKCRNDLAKGLVSTCFIPAGPSSDRMVVWMFILFSPGQSLLIFVCGLSFVRKA